MNNKITLLDGAVGTTLWSIAERNGEEKYSAWLYTMKHPEFVEEMTKEYLEAGSEIILTNTFSANRPEVKRVSDYDVKDVVTQAVGITKKVLSGSNAKVCLAVGPLSQLLEPYGDLEEDECYDIFDEMMTAGVEAGADCILIQTFIDLAMMKIAATAAKKHDVPVFCSMSFEKIGKTIFGNSVQDMIDELTPLGIDAIGMNCSIGPDSAVPIIKEFSEKTNLPLIFKPNAGKPVVQADGSVTTSFDATEFAKDIKPALEYVSYIGGCCGSDATYVREIKKVIEEMKP